jgi:hypothetical protein
MTTRPPATQQADGTCRSQHPSIPASREATPCPAVPQLRTRYAEPQCTIRNALNTMKQIFKLKKAWLSCDKRDVVRRTWHRAEPHLRKHGYGFIAISLDLME